MRLRAQLSIGGLRGALGLAALGLLGAWSLAGPEAAAPDWQGELSLGRRVIASERWWREDGGWRAERVYRWVGPGGALVEDREQHSGPVAWGGETDPWTGDPVVAEGSGWRRGVVTVRPVPIGAAPPAPVDAADWLAIPVPPVTVGRRRGADVRLGGVGALPEVPALQAAIPGGVRVDAPLPLEVPAVAPAAGAETRWVSNVDSATRARAEAAVAGLRGAAAVAALAAAAAVDVPAGFAVGGRPVAGVPGDCTERAERLVALAHGLGWPARVAAGVVYRDLPAPALRPHAWAEIWLGRWFPVDPSEPGGLAGPTHVRLVGPDEPDSRLVERLLSARDAEVRLR